MGITNENVSQTFSATSGQTLFPFSLNFFATNTLIVKKNGVALTAPDYSIGSLVGTIPYTGATITLTTGADLNDSVVVERVVPFTNDQSFSSLVSWASSAAAIQAQMDKVVLMAQEAKDKGVDALAAVAAMTPTVFPTPSALKGLRWNAAADALENAEFALSSAVSSIQGDVTTLQNSLITLTGRVDTEEAKSICFQNSINTLLSAVSMLIGKVNALELWKPIVDAYILDLRTRMLAVEKFFGTEETITILNNQLAPVEIPEFQVDGNVYTSVRLDYEIRRQDGIEYRISTGTVHLGFKPNGVWETDRNVVSFDVDGTIFTIVTVANDIGKVYYTTDNMVGGSYTGVMKVRKYSFGV